jgi:hypothetical protein
MKNLCTVAAAAVALTISAAAQAEEFKTLGGVTPQPLTTVEAKSVRGLTLPKLITVDTATIHNACFATQLYCPRTIATPTSQAFVPGLPIDPLEFTNNLDENGTTSIIITGIPHGI